MSKFVVTVTLILVFLTQVQAQNWGLILSENEVARQAALQITQVNLSETYDGMVPEPLLAIPVLEVSIDDQGEIKNIEVIRYPGQAVETADMAKKAIMRAAPFKNISAMNGETKFIQTFLYRDDRKFKLRVLD